MCFFSFFLFWGKGRVGGEGEGERGKGAFLWRMGRGGVWWRDGIVGSGMDFVG